MRCNYEYCHALPSQIRRWKADFDEKVSSYLYTYATTSKNVTRDFHLVDIISLLGPKRCRVILDKAINAIYDSSESGFKVYDSVYVVHCACMAALRHLF